MAKMSNTTVESMVPGDFIDYRTPNGHYAVRLYLDTELYGHVDVFNASGLSEAHPLETFPAAMERFESSKIFLRMVDRLIGK
jgi:hypothetical protein